MTEEKEIKQLPKGWKWVKLGEVCDKISLNKIKIKQKEYLEVGDYPVVDQGQELIGGYFNDKNLVVPREPPYIIFGDHTKVKKFINFNFIAGADGVKVLKAKDVIDSKFLYYSLFTTKIEDKGYARHFQLLEKELFPLPPKPTQLGIVSKIEELFSEIENGIKSLFTAKEQLKKYRQSVLKSAFEGKLTNGNVKEGELPEGWKVVELGNVCSLITDGKHGDCVNQENSGYYFLSAKDVKNNTLLWENSRQITKAGFEETHRRTNLHPGDICLVNTGATIGRISIAPNDPRTYRSTFQKSVAVIKCIPNLIDNKYCSYLLQGDIKKLVKVSSGTAVPNLLLGSLKKHEISLPAIEEQELIVEAIEIRLSVADKMEESITESLQQAEALKQSILKKAFEGKLIN
jgi:type I restriction enzyme S subunit